MGGCVSAPERCVGVRSSPAGKKRRWRHSRTGRAKARVSSQAPSDFRSLERIDRFGPSTRSYSNPAFEGGSLEELWFDSTQVLESDHDEDFHSVHEDMSSLNGFEGSSISSVSSFGNPNNGESCPHHVVLSPGNSVCNSVSEAAKSAKLCHAHSADALSQSKADDGPPNEGKTPVYIDEISSSMAENTGREEGVLVDCGILQNACLPCLASTVPQTDKRRPPSESSPRKKPTSRISFKWWEGNPNGALLSSKMLLQKPLAGSQVTFCPIDKGMFDCWSFIDPSTFKIRGKNYFRDKKKDFASNFAAYVPFGVDVFLSPRKIAHIARFVELPSSNAQKSLPPILVVNVQVPIYPAAIFQGETDGEGINFVLYFKLSDGHAKELPSHFQENLRKLIDDEVEKVKGFPVDSIIPFRERLKILGRVANVEDLHLSAAERKLMHAYNEKPVLSRPQHEFYSGENYLEIDLDMHRFSYISRKGFGAFLDRLKLCVLDIGLTIQGNRVEELPEQLLCCVRLSGIDYTKFSQLGMKEDLLPS